MSNYDINTLYTKYEYLKNKFGAEAVLEEFVQQMSSNALQDYLETTYENFDVVFDDDEE